MFTYFPMQEVVPVNGFLKLVKCVVWSTVLIRLGASKRSQLKVGVDPVQQHNVGEGMWLCSVTSLRAELGGGCIVPTTLTATGCVLEYVVIAYLGPIAGWALVLVKLFLLLVEVFS
jgi:hypothetical protein